MKKKILIISLICVFIIGCFVVFSVTNKKYSLFNKNKSNDTVDSTKLETPELTVDTLNVVDSLSLVTVDSSEKSKVIPKQKEVNKVDYWTKKTTYYIEKRNSSKAKYSFKKLKKYCKDKSILSNLSERISLLNTQQPSNENIVDNWKLSKKENSDTTYYIIVNTVSGTQLSNRYYTKTKAQEELKNFKKIISK